ncbi:UPF0182 family protein [Acidobacteria bacterium AB60]|nr:UPF0182 family protein [Acidobacteria bacterium AB60]
MHETILLPSRSGMRPRHRRLWFFFFLIIVVLLFSARTAVSYYVETLWFRSLGYGDVFWKTITLSWGVFAAFALLTFLLLYGWFRLLLRVAAPDLRTASTMVIGRRVINLPVEAAMRIGGMLLALLVALGAGAAMKGEWLRFALYWFRPSASGPADPIFSHPLSFYLFTLPAWQALSGWLLMLALLLCASGLFLVLISTGSRLTSGGFDGPVPLPWRTFSLAVAFLLLVIAMRVYLGRIELLLEDHTVFAGVSYTDAHVILGGMLAVCGALILGTAISAVNWVARPRLSWLVLAPVPAVVCYVLVQVAAWYVSTFIVKPNQLVREQPYIAHNIEFTRQAYGLDRITQQEFPAEVSIGAADPANNQATLQNIRLWDWQALRDTLRQLQEIRTYYDFPDVDIDRYKLNGQTREVMLAARELSVEKLPGSSRNWINEKLIYTHGYGITMNPVNGFTPEGLPDLLLSNMPIQSTAKDIEVTRPEIYFGELTDTDVYVKTRQPEFNYPQGESNSLTSYEGPGGIPMGGLMRRVLIAFDRGDLSKVPFSDDIGSESRLLMRRSVQERVTALAPFLTFESDPYIVVGSDGRLSWILDAFTTADTYPYASHYMLRDRPISYMRNSVKCVVDAYTGATTFYVFDPQDPIIAAYRAIFPSLFKDASAMPPDLRGHIRYPELLLKLQAQVYGLYHMTDPVVFYNREDLWTIASEIGMGENNEQATLPLQPNFVLMKLPGQSDVEFVDILPFTPANRNNLIGWIAGRSDGPNYGTAIAYNFPKTRLVDGPMQIEARIDQNAQLSGQLTLWNQQGSHVRRGTLLVIPCGKALIYAEPIYLQAERSPMPELRLVVLALQDKLAYAPTFEGALQSLFAGAPSSLNAESASFSAPAAASAAKTAPADRNSLISAAARDLADYQRLTAQGKLAEAGQKLEDLKQKLDALMR